MVLPVCHSFIGDSSTPRRAARYQCDPRAASDSNGPFTGAVFQFVKQYSVNWPDVRPGTRSATQLLSTDGHGATDAHSFAIRADAIAKLQHAAA
jgi:hypothetical protein